MRSGGTRRRPPAAALPCALAGLPLAACGAGRAGSAPAAPVPWTTTAPSYVTGVRLSGDRTLLFQARVPSGGAVCVRDLEAVLADATTDLARVRVTYVSPAADRASGCTEERSATAKPELPAPLRGRDVVVNNFTTFTPDGATPPALRLCGQLGCDPAPTGCTSASYEQAVPATDVPPHTTSRNAQRCDGEWLVLDLSTRMGPACAGETDPACSARQDARWFYRARKTGWRPVARTRSGGCTDVHRVEPAFPKALCATLEPLSG
ncbi:hypothetical protein FKN01_13240 [Streptomyces sp. 130]|nr:hypothetical protein FKN01_13240 [Streptomyces sp. 130]